MKGDRSDGCKPSSIVIETTVCVSDVVTSKRVDIDYIAKKCTFEKCTFDVAPLSARVKVVSILGAIFL